MSNDTITSLDKMIMSSISSQSSPSLSSPSLQSCVIKLNFTPTAEDTKNYNKCLEFWKFVGAQGRLKLIKEVPDEERYRDSDLKPKLPEKDVVECYCLKNILDMNAGPVTSAFETAMRCDSIGCEEINPCPTPPASTDNVTVLSRKLLDWDRHHKCYRVPQSKTPGIKAPSSSSEALFRLSK